MLEADLNDADFPRVTAEQRRNFLASTVDVNPASGVPDRICATA